eukprot:CAMPEP_0173452698 /NCGR_PEP_ID=MMETSP1357-20121228/49220_1 /TAXON_ID=77926 /ORGANISM="Hemiselmis rufescens, Strain PCC563" /LENGTH=311 /DNA_ID=CAMNT_0014419595 /DNA_START=39 /DNA_END=974 /DNA_ORIENTATION=+
MVDEHAEVEVVCWGPGGQRERVREGWFGHHVMSQPGHGVLVVPDTQQDPRFSSNPTIASSNIRFYAGAPLMLRYQGCEHCIGIISVTDTKPRGLEEGDDVVMQTLATACVREMECWPQRQEGAMTPVHTDGWLVERVNELKSHVPFSRRRVDEGCIRLFAEKLRPRVVHAGYVVTRVGEVGDTLYFIAKGACVCSLHGVELERLTAGHCFGEISLLNMCRMCSEGLTLDQAKKQCIRNADIVAVERCELLELHFDDAQPLLKKSPNLWFTLEDMTKRRMQSVNRAERQSPNSHPAPNTRDSHSPLRVRTHQ